MPSEAEGEGEASPELAEEEEAASYLPSVGEKAASYPTEVPLVEDVPLFLLSKKRQTKMEEETFPVVRLLWFFCHGDDGYDS